VLLEAARAHRGYLAAETLAVSLQLGDGALAALDPPEYTEQLQIAGLDLTIALRPAPRASGHRR